MPGVHIFSKKIPLTTKKKLTFKSGGNITFTSQATEEKHTTSELIAKEVKIKETVMTNIKNKMWLIASLILMMASCQAPTENKEKHSNKAKDNARVRKMLAAFELQEHRLEFNRCEMLYNGTPFRLDMTIKELISIFGDYDDKNFIHYIWKDIGIVATARGKNILGIDRPLRNMNIFLNKNLDYMDKEKYRHYSNTKKDYFLLEGMPVNRYMRVMDFIANSHYELGDFWVDDGYELRFDCNKIIIGYELKAYNTWFMEDWGIGFFKDKINPANENTFIEFYIHELDDINSIH